MKPFALAGLLLALPGAALARTPSQTTSQPQTGSPAATYPQRIPAPGGEVVLPSAFDRQAYDGWKYAAARRVGDLLYVSGAVAGPPPGTRATPESFKDDVRRAFRHLDAVLKASGSGWDQVVKINSYHVFDSPHFDGTKMQNFQAVSAVKDEFMGPPHPAWTAVGVTALLPDTGLVEIELIARVPPPDERR